MADLQPHPLQFEFQSWLSYVVAIPSICLLLGWPIAALVSHEEHAFINSFALAEPMLLSAFLLLGVAADVSHFNSFEPKPSLKLSRWEKIGVVLAVSLLFVYGFIRTNSQVALRMNPLPDALQSQLTALSVFMLVLLALTIVFSVFVRQSLLVAKLRAQRGE